MKQVYFLIVGLCVVSASYAETLRFSQPQIVTSMPKGVFLHLDAGGRRSLATTDGVVAVTWEDNSNGKPAVYVAYLLPEAKAFSAPSRISGESAAYEPAIVGFDAERFLVVWEEADNVWIRVVSHSNKGKVLKLSRAGARQISVGANGSGKVVAVWVQDQQQKNHHYITYADIDVKGFTVQASEPRLVDNSGNKTSQLYPVIELTKTGRVVAWEDRRHGHTRIFTAYADNRGSFYDHRLLNEFSPSPNPKFGKGSGAMRPVLSGDGEQWVVAAWMDKRNWRSGYDVYAALSANGGKEFGKNEQAQDMFAENIPQWHASVAMRKQGGIAAVAWDDTRNENADVFYSLRIDGVWSDDYEIPGATGPGRQSHPAIKYDKNGALHAVWLDTTNKQTKLVYVHSIQ